VAKAQGARSGLRYDADMGGEVPLASTASGQAWLACLADEEALTLVARQGFPEREPRGPTAPRTIRALQERLRAARKHGYAWVVESSAPGTAAMAAAIRHPVTHGVVGTVSVAGPSVRFTETHEPRARALQRRPRSPTAARFDFHRGQPLAPRGAHPQPAALNAGPPNARTPWFRVDGRAADARRHGATFVQTEPSSRTRSADRAARPGEARALFEKSRVRVLRDEHSREYGGGGLSAVDAMLVEGSSATPGHPDPARSAASTVAVGTDAQKELAAAGGARRRTCSIGHQPAGSRAAITTRAVRDGDGWQLFGNKHFISDGEFSDFFIVSAVTDPAERPRHVSLFLVDKDMPRLTVGRDQPMMGLTGTSHVELFFEGVKLCPENLLGAQGNGLAIAYGTLGRVRLAQVGARAIGKACRLATLMTSYANERKQFGSAIGEFQMIQQMIADSVIEINAARLMLLRAAWEIDQGRNARDWISMVKIEAAETLGRVADRAVQIFGGMGYCREMPIERLYRDARIYRIFDGTSEIHRTVVARGALKRGAALWDIGA
jgi:acyl-CoA dehydrogenase